MSDLVDLFDLLTWVSAEDDWMKDALCAQTDPDLFFPSKSEPGTDAKAICDRCDVRAQCLRYALEHGERFGIWGGLNSRQRARLQRRRCRSCGASLAGFPGSDRFCSESCRAEGRRASRRNYEQRRAS